MKPYILTFNVVTDSMLYPVLLIFKSTCHNLIINSGVRHTIKKYYNTNIHGKLVNKRGINLIVDGSGLSIVKR